MNLFKKPAFILLLVGAALCTVGFVFAVHFGAALYAGVFFAGSVAFGYFAGTMFALTR